MEYREELLLLTARLVRKYTHGESTSVTYETARQLMEAVIYCIKEYWQGEAEKRGIMEGNASCQQDAEALVETVTAEEEHFWEKAYQKGYEQVLFKVKKARALYHKIIDDFDDYGCQCYHDTIIKGIPQFFRYYDAGFCPQDHILTLDYPVLQRMEGLSGIDLIWEYLCCIRLEKEFLKKFRREFVIQVLSEVDSEYQEIYLENICEAVLENRRKANIDEKELLRQICPEREDLQAYLQAVKSE